MHWRLANEIARIESNYPNPLSAQELFPMSLTISNTSFRKEVR